jgi:HK97 family phage major capsid protein/HK97 family phage prohead protease
MMGNGYREILEHTNNAVDMSRAPIAVLNSHKHDQTPLGRVDDMRIVNRTLKGTLVFGSSQRASELWEDVKDGIARHLSISYVVLKKTRPDDDGVYRVLRWQPLECSVVSIPADPQAVIGRAFKEETNNGDVWRRVDKKMKKYNPKKTDLEKVDRIFNNADYSSYGEQLILIAKGRKEGDGGPEFWDQRLVIDRASQGLAEGSGGLGGFLAQPGFSERLLFGKFSSPIIKKVLSLRAENFRMKLPYAVSQDRSNGLFDGLQIYQVEQASELTASRPVIASIQPQLKKTVALAYATDELFADVNLLERWFFNLMSQGLTWDLERQLVRGKGHNEWLGLLESGAKIRIAKDAGQSANTVTSGNIVNMKARLTSESHYSNSTIWIYNPEISSQLYNLTTEVGTSGGGAVHLFRFKGPNEKFDTLAGHPLIPSEHASEIGSEGDLILVDLNYYLFIQKAIRKEISIHLNFLEDESCFRAVLRSDGMPIISKPITPANGNSTTSPVITIEDRG